MIPCKTCENCELILRKKYRMGSLIAFIGLLILFASILGIAVGALLVVESVPLAEEWMEDFRLDAESRMMAAGISRDLVGQVLDSRVLRPTDLERLSPVQAQLAEEVSSELKEPPMRDFSYEVGRSMLRTSLVGALLALLLRLRKVVLQCATCQAVVAAS
ncbi:MAG: hypothetical protein ISR76_10620 [Planctomycetes bacterium]|nr:hypothetical protein [Planctomycetota bacterium]MBL7009443.1 hypothetical protein [Planctomycetota bacterium]